MLKALLLSFTLAPRATTLSAVLSLAAMAIAQINLVPNGSFEDTVNCEVSTPYTLLKAAHWYNPNIATPDVWDCDSTRWCGSPMGPDGGFNPSYQYSYHGDRHAGMYCWFGYGSSNSRDFLGVKLTSSMLPGQAYEVSMRYARRRTYGLAIDHMGVWFGWDSLWQSTTAWLNVEPQLRIRDLESEYLDEADVWSLIKDTLIANGGEEWMVVGHFEPAATVNGIHYDPDGVTLCYYFLDDVVVRPLEDTAIYEPVYWNGHGLVLRGDASSTTLLKIHDVSGRLLQQHMLKSGDQVGLSDLPPGVYVISLSGNEGRWTVKVLKE